MQIKVQTRTSCSESKNLSLQDICEVNIAAAIKQFLGCWEKKQQGAVEKWLRNAEKKFKSKNSFQKMKWPQKQKCKKSNRLYWTEVEML